MWDQDCGCIPVVDEERADWSASSPTATSAWPCAPQRPTSARGSPGLASDAGAAAGFASARKLTSATSRTSLRHARDATSFQSTDGGGRLVGLISLHDLARQAGRAGERRLLPRVSACAKWRERSREISQPWAKVATPFPPRRGSRRRAAFAGERPRRLQVALQRRAAGARPNRGLPGGLPEVPARSTAERNEDAEAAQRRGCSLTRWSSPMRRLLQNCRSQHVDAERETTFRSTTSFRKPKLQVRKSGRWCRR